MQIDKDNYGTILNAEHQFQMCETQIKLKSPYYNIRTVISYKGIAIIKSKIS